MKKELKKVLLLMSILIVIIVGCNSKTKEIDVVKDKDNTKDISVNEPVKELPNLVFSTSIENLKIELTSYEIIGFEGSFVLENLDNVDYDFTIRIPLYSDQVTKEAGRELEQNAVIYKEDEEVRFSIKAGERKTIELNSNDYEFYTANSCAESGGFGKLDQLYLMIENNIYLMDPEKIIRVDEIDLGNSEHIRENALLNNQIFKLSKELKVISDENMQLKESVDEKTNSVDYVTSYFGQKWSKAIGIRQLSEEAEVHIFPNILSPKVDFAYPGQIVTTIEYVWAVDWDDEPASKGEWFVIMTNDGQVGFVMENGLEKADESEYEWIYDYNDVTERIAGCTIGDRVEKLIGTLDQDYMLAHENSRIYVFQDTEIADSSEKLSPFTPGGTLDVFTGYTNHMGWMRSDSEAFRLDSGIGVGSSVKEVLDYYAGIYERVEITERFGESGYYIVYQIGKNAELVFEFKSDITDNNSKVMYIQIRRLGMDNRFG